MWLSSEQKKALNLHLDLVLEANKIHNLTNIKERDKAQILHVEDSLKAVDYINDVDKPKILDIGSGAGYPGIPIAIATGYDTYLCETVRKKCDCLESFITTLKINSNVFVINNRIENLSNKYNSNFDIVTARALSSLSSLLELASPLLKIGGLLICYKSKNIDEEYNNALHLLKYLGYELYKNDTFTLTDGTNRRIIVYKKVNDANIKLPRKLGFAQKKPLSLKNVSRET